jgi:hypothetical protein
MQETRLWAAASDRASYRVVGKPNVRVVVLFEPFDGALRAILRRPPEE